MQVLAKSELELPGVVPGGQWLGHRFVIGAHAVNDLVDDDPEPSERFLGSTGQPRQRRKLDARGDELGVLGGPGHVEAVACGVGDLRVNIQNDHGKAKTYQVRQVLQAIEKLKEQ